MIIQSELDAIEEGLELLQHEYPSGKGILDFLCVDSGGRLVIIEVKLYEHKDILFQALRYFSDIDKNRYLIATVFPDRGIAPEESPRIILIAEKIPEDVRRLSTLVVPEVELLEYSAVTLPSGDKGIIYHSVSLPVAARPPAEPRTIEKLIEYLREDRLKPTIEEMRNAIKDLGRGIKEYATQGYIGYKHSSGRQFAFIKIYRKDVEFGAHIIDEDRQLLDYESIRVERDEEDYSEILEKVRTSFINLGGKVDS
jgi:hypothetical protein